MEFFCLYFDDVLLLGLFDYEFVFFNAKPLEQGRKPLTSLFDENTCWSTTLFFD